MRNLKNGQKLFTEKELTLFGEYVLSEERTNSIKQNHKNNKEIDLNKKLKNIHHSDYQNFLVKISK